MQRPMGKENLLPRGAAMSFEIAVDRVLAIEGGYTSGLKDDPGGETNYGISKHSYPKLNIKTLTREQAVDIYRRDFWVMVHADDDLPPLLQFQALDFAVNCGIGTAIRKLQSALGIADDGHWGPISRATMKKVNPTWVAFRFFAEELDYRRKLNNWPTFSKGWTARVATDLRYAADDLLMPSDIPGPGVIMASS